MIYTRLNNDGSENLNWWFGERSTSSLEISEVIITRYSKPQYVRYTMVSLKKRSTKRLSKMYFNMFGKSADREIMINDLYRKLNQLWAQYNKPADDMQIDEYGSITFKHEIPGFIYPTAKRGRKQKFDSRQCVEIIGDYELGDLNLVKTAEKWNTNIATVSNIINGKGTYAFLFHEDI